VNVSEEQRVEQLAGFACLVQLILLIRIGCSRSGNQAVSPTPKPQVGRRTKRIVRIRMAPLLGGVDEVKREVTGDERDLSDRLHTIYVTGNLRFAGNVAPMKGDLPVQGVTPQAMG
jgi:hypothetical protein